MRMVFFAAKLIRWQEKHGRHHLPWQHTRDPYAVWLSEIMLQQTQVNTVIPYYQRFLQSFPDIQCLAQASTMCWLNGAAWAITPAEETCTEPRE